MILELIIVLLAGMVLAASLLISLWLVRSIKSDDVVEKWVILQVVLFVIGVFYVVILLIFLQFDIEAFISFELVASLTLLLTSIYVGGASYLFWKAMRGMYGTDISDKVAINRFLRFANLPASAAQPLLDKEFDLKCEVCNKTIEYSIADVVRSHPDLDSGVEIEDGLGETNFTFFVRHECDRDYREIPVMHDHNMVPRSQKESRSLFKM